MSEIPFAVAIAVALSNSGLPQPSTSGGAREHTPVIVALEPDHPNPKLTFDAQVALAPTAFRARAKWHLVYELHLANTGSSPCKLTRIEVVSADAARVVLTDVTGTDLLACFKNASPSSATLAPGASAVVCLWVTVDERDDVPDAIVHRIGLQIGADPELTQIETPPVEVDRAPVAVIAPPLRGDGWLCVNGGSNQAGHRRALVPIEGREFIAQRFAIDWVQLHPEGSTYRGDPSDNENYRAYGAEIHSVAEGVVSAIEDGIPENVPGETSRAVPITLENAGGNHVIVDIGNGRFAFYAHMQPGSLRVKVGDRVRAGDVLGLVGNSGNSTEPHHHFHVCNANSPLASEGLPFAFARFETEEWVEVPTPHRTEVEPVLHEQELPLENDVVRFGP